MKILNYIRPSSSQRWLECSGFVGLALVYDNSPTLAHPSAAAGTKLHVEASQALHKAIKNNKFVNCDEQVQGYIDYVKSYINDKPRAVLIEQLLRYKVPKAKYSIQGTPDCVIVNKDTIHIFDFKTGAIRVSPVNNPQLYLYSLMVMQKYKKSINFDNVNFHLHIYQNNSTAGNNIQSCVVGLHDSDLDCMTLNEFATIVEDRVGDILSQSYKYKTGDHCRYCPVKSYCYMYNQEYNNAVTQVAAVSEYSTISTMTTEELDLILQKAEYVEPYIEAAKTELKKRLDNGETCEGHSLRTRKASSVWSDADKAMDYLTHNASTVIDDIAPRVLQSPAVVNKILKDNDLCADELDNYIVEKPSTTYIAKNRQTKAVKNSLNSIIAS